jgi:hypothetical protein
MPDLPKRHLSRRLLRLSIQPAFEQGKVSTMALLALALGSGWVVFALLR